MIKVLILGRGGSINPERVIAVANAKSTPINRMLKATDPGRIINMTYGYPRRSVIVMDNGYVVLSSRSPGEMAKALGLTGELSDEEPVPWW